MFYWTKCSASIHIFAIRRNAPVLLAGMQHELHSSKKIGLIKKTYSLNVMNHFIQIENFIRGCFFSSDRHKIWQHSQLHFKKFKGSFYVGKKRDMKASPSDVFFVLATVQNPDRKGHQILIINKKNKKLTPEKGWHVSFTNYLIIVLLIILILKSWVKPMPWEKRQSRCSLCEWSGAYLGGVK